MVFDHFWGHEANPFAFLGSFFHVDHGCVFIVRVVPAIWGKLESLTSSYPWRLVWGHLSDIVLFLPFLTDALLGEKTLKAWELSDVRL